jgi:hypothetical protein
MMIAVMTLLALAFQTATSQEGPTRATPDGVLARVVACGVKRSDARVRDDATLREDVVAVRDGVALSDAQLDCLAKVATETYWFLRFDAATQARFQPLEYRASEAASLVLAKAWVAAHGLAARVPRYREGHDDPALATAAIEKLCNAPAGSFSNDDSTMIAKYAPSLSSDEFMCAMNVATAAGLKFGFIGNEAVEPGPQR